MSGTFDTESYRQIVDIADQNGIKRASLLAVAWVESDGVPYWSINGRQEPAIRFEGHYFDRILGKRNPAKQALARARGLASPRAGAIRNPPNAKRYELLQRAKEIDTDAAVESCSWGSGEVMGAHWRVLGYSSAGALETSARRGVAGQVDMMVRFIVHNNLKDELNSQDWAKFARGYNGPNYAAGGYHTKMAAAYRKFLNAPEPVPGLERPQSASDNIRDLQLRLKAFGFDPGPVDGEWGPMTSAAVGAYQRRYGLPATGELDDATRARLQLEPRPLVDPKRALDTEDDLAKKGSETIKLSKRGRLFGILGMITGALGFVQTQNGFSGTSGEIDRILENSGMGSDTFLPALIRLVMSMFSGGGLWVALFVLAIMYYRNSGAIAQRRLDDHREGLNIRF